jgi:chemotaxis methyl-accepting protein methylase
VSGAEYDRFLRALAPELGIDWRKYRRRQSRRGLLARLSALGLGDLDSYRDRLLSDPGEAERLIAALRVTVTRFLRDPEVWSELVEVVLPELLRGLPSKAALRAWSVGCCGGEEPYTLALLWEGLPRSLRAGHGLKILATDLDEAVLSRARAARYPASATRSLPGELREVGFEGEGRRLRVADRIRRRVRLEKADLLVDPPPTGCRLVLCRYLAFTYYRGERLARASAALLASLAPGGALVTGTREPRPPELDSRFEPWPGTTRVFRPA